LYLAEEKGRPSAIHGIPWAQQEEEKEKYYGYVE
jgi:hypothetical protein